MQFKFLIYFTLFAQEMQDVFAILHFYFHKKNRPATVIFGESLQVCDFVLFLSRMCSFVPKHKIGINNTGSSNNLSFFSLNHKYNLPQSDRVRLNRQALRCQEGAEGHRELLSVHEQLQQSRQSYPWEAERRQPHR